MPDPAMRSSARSLSVLALFTAALACGAEPSTTSDAAPTDGTGTGDPSGTASTTASEATGASNSTSDDATDTVDATSAATSTTHGATTHEPTTHGPTTEAATTAGTEATTDDACEAEATDECTGCMREQCCDALADCQGDVDCVACVSGENPDVCESSPETHERVDAYLACKGGACQPTCIGDPVGSCEDALAELTPDACTTCLGDACCDQIAACHGNEVCWNGCFVVHDDDVCHSDPDGHALYHALSACASTSCQAECF